MKSALWYITLVLLAACSSPESPADWLEGTWQVQGSDQFESWQWSASKDSLLGQGYRMYEGQQKVLETLFITQQAHQWVLGATVPSQNEGRTIIFEQDKAQAGLCFVNPQHDFPQRIQYLPIHPDTLLVQVAGADQSGFNMRYLRVHQ